MSSSDSSSQVLLTKANAGDVDAMAELAMAYDTGARGVSKDHFKAVEWYLKAAAKGNLVSKYNLGVAYLQGEGT